MDLLRSLESAGIDLRKQKKEGEYLAICPNCQKLKLAINVDKQRGQCWTCGQGGGTFWLSKWLGIKLEFNSHSNISKLRRKYIEVKPLERKPISDTNSVLPCEFIPLTNGDPSSILGRKAVEYLKGRDVDMGMVASWGLGYCPSGKYRNMIVIPVTDEKGEITTFQTRRFTGLGDKNLNPPLVDKTVFNLHLAQGHPGVVVVEGPWDSIAVHSKLSAKHNISSLGLLGHTCDSLQAKQIANYIKPEVVFLGLDPDISLQEAEVTGSKLVSEGLKVKICQFPKDPDELSEQELLYYIENSKDIVRRRIVSV